MFIVWIKSGQGPVSLVVNEHIFRSAELCRIERSRTRRQLRALDDYILEDVGLTRKQAMEESSKYFWQH